MDDIIDVVDENGVNHKIEVIDIFNVEGYDHDYIFYGKNTDVANAVDLYYEYE